MKKANKTAEPGAAPHAIQQTLAAAMAHHGAGRLAEAESHYRKILQAEPKQPVALHLLGVVAHQQGKNDRAVDLIGQALAVKPDFAEAHSNLGLALQALGQVQQAEASYRKALAIKPAFAKAHGNLGNALKEQGELDAAVASYRQALSIQPNLAETLNNLGLALRELGKLAEAGDSFERALAIRPDFMEACNNLGLVLQDLGQRDEAVGSYRNALAINPNYAEALANLGNAFSEQGKFDDAIASYRQALAVKPGSADVHFNLGNAFRDQGKLDEAVENYHQALAIKPDFVEALCNLGNAFNDQWKLDEAVASYRQAVAIKPDYDTALSNLAFCEQYKIGVTLKKLNAVHSEWDRHHGLPLRSEWREHDNDRDPDRPLRLGFVSPNLGRHPVGYFIIGLFEKRPRQDVQIICYSDRNPDDLTERLKALTDEWTDTRRLPDSDLTERIRADRIDILIDLAGHGAKNRLLVIARKPAPLQVKWVGYAGSVGLSAIDYLIADKWHVPPGTERQYLEKIIRLPGGYVSYEPPDYAPNVGPLPYAQNGFVTFGCFNNPSKINDHVLSAWAKILTALPDARLILKYRNMDAGGNRSRMLDYFESHGIAAARITLEGKSPHKALLERYLDIDIALDSFPYTGGLTTCEAIWMGVPVITTAGETFASRHSLSHLTNSGLGALVAEDLQDYVVKALALANDVPRLTDLRGSLRERLASCPLCDAEKFATDFTAAMRRIWQDWCSKI
jgi:protein O-GlcNAc transferase